MLVKSPQAPLIQHIKTLDTHTYPWCFEACLLHIHGRGAFHTESRSLPDPYDLNPRLTTFTLNNVPLVQSHVPYCPTCAHLLATGYGIENAHCAELTRVQNVINADFINLSTSLQALTPLLGLLETGLYVLADTVAYPTDGNGRFFWDVPNALTPNSATAGVLTKEGVYVKGSPVFLYPTQSSSCFSEQRMAFYVKKYQQYDTVPRAIAYHHAEFISLILDGHHKICAAALLKKMARCIAIIPLSGGLYAFIQGDPVLQQAAFVDIAVPLNDIPPEFRHYVKEKMSQKNSFRALINSHLISHPWPLKYRRLADHYPTVEAYAERAVSGNGWSLESLVQ